MNRGPTTGDRDGDGEPVGLWMVLGVLLLLLLLRLDRLSRAKTTRPRVRGLPQACSLLGRVVVRGSR